MGLSEKSGPGRVRRLGLWRAVAYTAAAVVALLAALLAHGAAISVQAGQSGAEAPGVAAGGAAAAHPDQNGAEQNGAHAAEIRDAEAAAEGWLKLVDSGKYEASWKQFAGIARNQIAPEAWKKQVGATRESYGAVTGRRVQSAEYATTLPGAPDGQYVVLKYASSFVHKATAVETVALAREGSGWKVAGYYLR